MFYDRFVHLCSLNNISLNKAATEIGLSNSTVTKWKKTGATPHGTTLNKIANYFNVSINYLLDIKETDIKKETVEYELNDLEKEFIELFRLIPQEAQPLVLQNIRAALKAKNLL